MKSNSVITALKHLKGKGLIERRGHYSGAFEYRVVEPAEIAKHDIISYVAEHQPKQMAAIVRELECNRRRLPPRYLKISEAAKFDGKAAAPSIRPGTGGIAPAAIRALPLGIEPNTKPITRKKKPINNMAPAGARPGQTSFSSKAGEFRIRPKPNRLTNEPGKPDAAKLALTEARQWQDELRKARVSRSDLLAWQKQWHETMEVRWPDGRVKFSERAFRTLKLAVEQRDLLAEDIPAFIRWTVTQWDTLRRAVFSFNSKTPYGPEMPDPEYVVRMLPKIHAAYVRRKRLEKPISYTRPRSPPAPVLRTTPVDPVRTEAARNRMNLPKWE
jgi:hypothetical protein